MHTDEAVNAYIVGQLLAGERYTYDPVDRHGPALAALALPLARMQGAKSFSDLTESQLRLTPVVAGTMTILLFGAAVEMFGFVPSISAALLFALAPLPVYYDRYFIHEPLFCAATLAFSLSAWYAHKSRSVGRAMLAGGCAALMLACKETAVLHFCALAAAVIVYCAWNLRTASIPKSFRLRPLLAALASFFGVFVTLYTWCGRSWRSLFALTQVVTHVIARAAGQGHQQPFWYYGKLLAGGWSGGLLLALACAGILISLKQRDDSPYPFFAYYCLFLTVIYSFIPYKTPWLALNLWLPMSIFAGMTAELLWRWTGRQFGRYRAVPALCMVVIVGVLIGHDTRQRVFLDPTDENNPYAYAHTSEDILGLPTEIAEIAQRDGIRSPRIAVIASDAWPLPWYLRHFNQVGFWQPGQQVGDADFYITSTDSADQYADRLRGFRPDFFGVRPGVLILLWLPEPK